ncbi:Anti-sigma F factor antagonist (spoIIAA-2) [Lachnospiraceae bacterium TWA4]|nr:Anti-sigma F factor antagonist (spoIIAA-2) [Lachnospiraceae bacterium TWA4]
MIHYELEGTTLFIQLPEQFDHHNSINLVQDTDHLIKEYRLKNLVFDFTNTRFMDSSGIGILLGRYKRMRTLCGKVFVYGTDERICRIMDMAGLSELILEWV